MYCFRYFSYLLTTLIFFFFFFNDTATTEIYTLSLHDALPISRSWACGQVKSGIGSRARSLCRRWSLQIYRSEEHTSELQSQSNLVCRLLLEKKKKKTNTHMTSYHSCTIRTRAFTTLISPCSYI